MKQVLQQARTGEIEVVDVPTPKLLPGCVLVRIAASLVSTGTERASAEFASKNLLQKAQARPDLVREVLSKVRRDGLFPAMAAVQSRLDVPTALGYSSAGSVVEVGEGVTDLRAGDRVACAGASYAVHAEFACVPRLLVAQIPKDSDVTFEEAAFTTVGAVAIHGVRTAEAKLGDTVAVIGLGLLGQLAVQILKASGCRVIGFDLRKERTELARNSGADQVSDSPSVFTEQCFTASKGRGVDSVLIAAETSSSDPVNLAGTVARDRGIVVAVGTVGMDIERKLYYEKELDFRVSRSYGPGRYDTAYEQKGRDYPAGYVRWTENRNMEAFLQLLSDRELAIEPLISHRIPVEQAARAYQIIQGQTGEPFLGVLISYSGEAVESPRLELVPRRNPTAVSSKVSIGLIGAGNFATSTLLPAIRQDKSSEFAGVCAATGSHARHAGKRFGFRYCATDNNELLRDPEINTVVVATRHNLHAEQVMAALAAGKHTFCEKPLCLSEPELANIARAYQKEGAAQGALLMVGYNRRFAPMAVKMKAFLSEIQGPLAMHYRVNAGYLPPDHWTNDPEEGGGRIVGEVCHFVDLLCYLSGSMPVEVQARGLSGTAGDNVMLGIHFANGSEGTIHYLVNGDKTFSKERLEVFGGGAVAVLEDFRRLDLVRHGRKRSFRSRLKQDKGHRGEWAAFAAAIRNGGPPPIPFEQIVAVTLATLRARASLASGKPEPVDAEQFLGSSLQSDRAS